MEECKGEWSIAGNIVFSHKLGGKQPSCRTCSAIYIYMVAIFSIARLGKHSYCPRCETGPLFSIMTAAMAAVIIENNGPASCMIMVYRASRTVESRECLA